MARRKQILPPRMPFAAIAVCSIGQLVAGEGGRIAQAQPAAPAPEGAASVQPPRPTNDSPVAYPVQAISEGYFVPTTVTLVLDIDANGAVTAATVEGAAEYGFADEARAAALRLQFTPAMRAGVAIPSRIKYHYQFLPPPPVLVGRVVRAADDTGIAGVAVTLSLADGTTQRSTTDLDGRYRFEGLVPGPIRIEVNGNDLRTTTAEDRLDHAEETNIVLRAEPSAPPPPPGPAASVGEEIPQEVVVRGTKPPREVVRRTLERQEIAQLPGTNGDALRSVESLPGVARPALGPMSGQLIVRGADAQDTTVLIDGTPVPLVYHFGGLSSVVPTETVESLDFYPGNSSSSFGRGMGGVVDVGLRNPKADAAHGMVQLDLIDLRLLVEAPIARTGWKLLAGGRRSWFDVWLGPILSSASSGSSAAPRYYDYQVMLQREIDTSSSFRATFFGSDDSFRIVQSGAESAGAGGALGIATRFWRLQTVYQNQFTERALLKATAAYGTDTVSAGFGSNFVSTLEYPLSLRSELSYKLSSRIRANAGVDMIYMPYRLAFRFPEASGVGDQFSTPGRRTVTANNNGSRLFSGAYTEWEIAPWRGARVVPGFRADYISSTSATDLSPRLNLRQELFGPALGTALKGAVGLFFQPPSAAESDPTFGQRNLQSQRSVHYGVGIEQQLPIPGLKLSVDGFYKQMDRLVMVNQGNSGEGRAYGLEWFLRYQGHPRLFGWIAYTLSRSERRDAATEAWHRFQYDQTHILTAVGSYELGRGWRMGGRVRYVTGNGYTPSIRGAYDSTVGATIAADSAARYAARLPDFQQIDLRVDKMWAFRTWKFSIYLDVQNALNRRAVEGVVYNYDYTQSAYTKGLTILPSLGLRGEF